MSDGVIHDYLAQIGRYPVLTKEAQLRHCRRIQEWVSWPGGRDNAPLRIRKLGERSLNLMVTTNIRLVVSIAKRYQNRGLDLADLIQEGTLGLIRGLELFDPTRGYAVSTYSFWWIRQAITRAIHTHARTIRLPINTHELIARIQRFTNEFTTENGTSPSISQIAEHLETTPERISQVLQTNTLTSCSSLDAICIDGGSTIGDLVATPTTSNESEPDEFLTSTTNREAIQRALGHLSPTEARVVWAHYFEGRTLREIATEHGFSRCRAGQLQRTALTKLRRVLALQGQTP